MLKYIILFVLIGAGIGWFVRQPRPAFLIMIVIAILWGLSSRMIWGFVSFGELMLGFGIVRYMVLKRNE